MRQFCRRTGRDALDGSQVEEITHAYSEKSVHLKFFTCKLLSGAPQPPGCAAFKWVNKTKLADFNFPAADAQLLEKLSRLVKWTEVAR
ncbi:MAG TPA: hypothetical protein DCQ92_05370 [Verrucomicrobia subdivision 3 bacterium]|nr:hypothetical protein [Limisphaerales bacterium]